MWVEQGGELFAQDPDISSAISGTATMVYVHSDYIHYSISGSGETSNPSSVSCVDQWFSSLTQESP